MHVLHRPVEVTTEAVIHKNFQRTTGSMDRDREMTGFSRSLYT